MRAPPSLVTTQKLSWSTRSITFTQLLELVHQKLNIDPQQDIQHLHFRCPIFESGQCYMYTSFILRDDADVRQMFNIFYSNPSLPFVKLFVIICHNNNPLGNHGSTSNLENLSYEYETYWVKNQDSDTDSSSRPKGSNLSLSHETIFKQDW
ncbi:hypothetical protein HKD37_19G054738 [Glycine soja]